MILRLWAVLAFILESIIHSKRVAEVRILPNDSSLNRKILSKDLTYSSRYWDSTVPHHACFLAWLCQQPDNTCAGNFALSFLPYACMNSSSNFISNIYIYCIHVYIYKKLESQAPAIAPKMIKTIYALNLPSPRKPGCYVAHIIRLHPYIWGGNLIN